MVLAMVSTRFLASFSNWSVRYHRNNQKVRIKVTTDMEMSGPKSFDLRDNPCAKNDCLIMVTGIFQAMVHRADIDRPANLNVFPYCRELP